MNLLSKAAALAILLAGAVCAAAGGKTPTTAQIADTLEELDKADRSDWILRYRAISRLGRWKVAKAAEPLRAILAGKDHPWVRGRALVALSEILGDKMSPEALRYAKDPAPPLRAAAVEALGLLATPPADAAVEAALKDEVPSVRHQAAVSLARLRKAKAWPVLQPLLAGKDVQMVRHATRALVYVASPDAAKKVAELLEHPDDDVRFEATRAMRTLRLPDAIPRLLGMMAADKERIVQREAQGALGAYDPKILSGHMIAALRSKGGTKIYRGALRLLSAAPTDEVTDVVAALIATEEGPYKDVLHEMLMLLADGKADRHKAVFLKYLDHKNARVRAEAVVGLGRCKSVDHFAALKDRLIDQASVVRSRAFEVLAKSTKGAPAGGILEYLAGPLTGRDGRAFMLAMGLLGDRISGAELAKGLGSLEEILAGPDAYRRGIAIRGLEKKADDAAKGRIARAQGYLVDWQIIGPFPNNETNRGFSVVYPPEIAIDLKTGCDAHEFGHGATFEVGTDPEKSPNSITLGPPSQDGVGKTILTFFVKLPKPAKDLKLSVTAALARQNADNNGVTLSVRIDGKDVDKRKILKDAEEKFKIDLAAHAGKTVQLDLVLDALGEPDYDETKISELAITDGGRLVVDLFHKAGTASARVELDGKPKKKIGWVKYRAADAYGKIVLHHHFEPPTHYKVAYAVADFDVPEAKSVFLDIKAENAIHLQFNGKTVFRAADLGAEKRQPGSVGGKPQVQLRKGPNRLVAKVANLKDWWYFQIRVVDAKNRSALHARSPAPQPER